MLLLFGVIADDGRAFFLFLLSVHLAGVVFWIAGINKGLRVLAYFAVGIGFIFPVPITPFDIINAPAWVTLGCLNHETGKLIPGGVTIPGERSIPEGCFKLYKGFGLVLFLV